MYIYVKVERINLSNSFKIYGPSKVLLKNNSDKFGTDFMDYLQTLQEELDKLTIIKEFSPCLDILNFMGSYGWKVIGKTDILDGALLFEQVVT